MSQRLFADDVLFFQRLLSCAGCYKGELDGDWGPKTDKAAAEWDAAFVAIRTASQEFDGRTEGNLRTLLPGAQVIMRRLVAHLRAEELDARIISGTRTYAEQNALYAKGRSAPGDKVTNARGGHSNHNFGIAVDIGIFQAGKYQLGHAVYERAGKHASEEIDWIEWGGLWRTFPDKPHFQAKTNLRTVQVRAKFEKGEPFLPDVPAFKWRP